MNTSSLPPEGSVAPTTKKIPMAMEVCMWSVAALLPTVMLMVWERDDGSRKGLEVGVMELVGVGEGEGEGLAVGTHIPGVVVDAV